MGGLDIVTPHPPPPPPTTITMSSKKQYHLSSAMKRTSEWISSQEIPSDITVQAGGTAFSLHKLPLVSKCGYIRKLVSKSNQPDLSFIDIPDIPGGAESFELVVKFCYGMNIEIDPINVAALRCAAQYLEMAEDYSPNNLISHVEAYIEQVVLLSLSSGVTVLHCSESLQPVADEVKLVSRCIEAVACIACNECDMGSFEGAESGLDAKPVVDWWAEDLTVLRIDMFQRVLIAMNGKGLRPYALGPLLMLYAQKSLRGLDIFGKGKKKMDPKLEHEKRVILETIAHPDLTEVERKKVCTLMDCQKLSREACAHAAQNDRLPVQTVVQVMYYEQQRLRNTMNGGLIGGESPAPSHKSTTPATNTQADEILKLRRENQDLKMEVVRMRMLMKELEKPSARIPFSQKPPLPKKSFIKSVSNKLGRLYPFLSDGKTTSTSGKTRPSKNWRHSIS
ncbi:BTB/POZ domain-containing protein [Acorus gramineus]|uniref:BTB/POZ domain-containing protein n=1 Tax=Acorus gramineus TaxID=55184 RepID=A0AAV9AUY8_ACOGR|nr:BTB/POZ domain-containing protein [Acorus gramineus]